MIAVDRASVIVVGAGPAGCLAAIGLARAGVDVCVLDRDQASAAVGETLSPEGRRMLSRADLWERIPSSVAIPCPGMLSAWGGSRTSSRSFITNPYGPAWHLDRIGFDRWLRAETAREGVRLVCATARSVERVNQDWLVTLDDGTARLARFLVIATGRRSAFARRFGARTNHDPLCVLGVFSTSSSERSAELVVEAVPDGWWYSMPTPDGRMFAGWVTDGRSLRARDRSAMFARSLRSTRHIRSRVAETGRITVRSAVVSTMDEPAGDGWIAIGDAAISRDPLSGDGLASALRAGWDAVLTVQTAIAGDVRAVRATAHAHKLRAAEYHVTRTTAYASQVRWSKESFWSSRGR